MADLDQAWGCSGRRVWRVVWRYKTVNLLTNAHCQFLGSLAKFISGVVTDTLVVGEKHRYKQLFAMALKPETSLV